MSEHKKRQPQGGGPNGIWRRKYDDGREKGEGF